MERLELLEPLNLMPLVVEWLNDVSKDGTGGRPLAAGIPGPIPHRAAGDIQGLLKALHG